MYIEQLYTNCLAEAAYYIESEGEAVIIDPLRETEPYLALAEKRNSKIKYVLETHFHADFVSGHIDLAQKANATIVYGSKAEPNYDVHLANDGEILTIGKIKIKVLHTPGHTPESVCYLLIDENGNNHSIFTGDTLFVGDVGRPDLAVKSDLSQEDLAGLLYDSLQKNILPLADNVIVYPAHGPGSACGKNIGKETFSTIGEQKANNYALQPQSKANFIEAVTSGLSPAPQYFFHDAAINKAGYENIDEVISKNLNLLSVDEFDALSKNPDTLILDTRTPDEFEVGFIPNSINIGLNGQFGPWVGALINPKAALILVCTEGKESESVLRLARVGYENVKGILKNGINAWKNAGKSLESVTSIEPNEFVKDIQNFSHVIDVRKPGEWNSGVLEAAQLITLDEIEKNASQLSPENTYHVHCAGGYRSMIAASLLKKKGIKNVINIKGGMAKIKEAGAKIVELQTV